MSIIILQIYQFVLHQIKRVFPIEFFGSEESLELILTSTCLFFFLLLILYHESEFITDQIYYVVLVIRIVLKSGKREVLYLPNMLQKFDVRYSDFMIRKKGICFFNG